MHVSYEQLIAYAAEETDIYDSASIAAHVTICPECAATIINYGLAGDAIRMLGAETPSPAVLAQVYALAAPPVVAQPTWLETLSALFMSNGRRFAYATVALVLIAIPLLVLAAGMVSFSQNAVAGDMLYPIKTTVENVQVATAFSDSDKARQEIGLAGVRVEEIQVLADRQQYDRIPDTERMYEGHVQRAMDALHSVFRNNAEEAQRLAQEVNGKLAQYTQTLVIVAQSVPVATQSSLASAVSASSKAISTLAEWQSPPPVVPSLTPAAATTRTVPATTKTAPAATQSAVPSSVPTGAATGSQPGPADGATATLAPAGPTTAPPGPTAVAQPTKDPHGSPGQQGTPESPPPGQVDKTRTPKN